MGVGRFDDGERLLGGSEYVGGAAGGGGVLGRGAGVASMPIAKAYSAMPEPTNATAVCMASEPALQANSMSAALTAGVAPMASATIVAQGFTA